MAAPRDVADLLRTTADFLSTRGIDSARLDAELMLGRVLGLERLQLYTSFDRPLHAEELNRYRTLIRRRAAREPVAYILGEKEFYSRPFEVDPRVLIPRPDTEVLIDCVLEQLPEGADGVVLDYGTGSGAIALTLAAERPSLRFLAIDISADALAVAKVNAQRHKLTERVGFVRSDGLSSVPERFRGSLLAIVSNPPYVPKADRATLQPEILNYEPELALFAEGEGLTHYARLTEAAPSWLVEDGLLALEVGRGQSRAVEALLDEAGFDVLDSRNDLAGIPRVVLGRRRPSTASTRSDPVSL